MFIKGLGFRVFGFGVYKGFRVLGFGVYKGFRVLGFGVYKGFRVLGFGVYKGFRVLGLRCCPPLPHLPSASKSSGDCRPCGGTMRILYGSSV